MVCLPSLPDEVLKLILQRVPLQHRLSSCSLVSRRLHQAAAAATEEVPVDLCGSSGEQQLGRADSFLLWLDRHGQHLTRLCMGSFPQPLAQQLPCPQLLDLVLSQCSVQLDPADGHPGVIQGLTKLTSLELADGTNIRAPESGVLGDSLSQLLCLQHLSVSPDGVVLSGATLAGLRCLTRLDVCLTAGTLPQLSALTALEHFTLRVDSEGQAPVGVSDLLFPASLKHLVLLSPLEADILSLVPTGLQELRIGPSEELVPVVGPGSFLAGVARLQHLTKLYVHLAELPGGVNWPAPGPAYSALTASSSLVSLDLAGHFPAGICSHVFPAGRTLQHLTRLLVHEVWDGDDPPPPWDAADVSCVVDCCPHLHSLHLSNLQAGAHVAELHKLTALTFLNVVYESFDDAAASCVVQGLAALEKLRSLQCELYGVGWEVAALLPLTSLTGLTQFACSVPDPNAADQGITIWYTVKDTWPATPVWVQLLGRCAVEPACQVAALCSLEQQLAGPSGAAVQRAATVNLQKQLGTHWGTTTKQERQLARHEERLAHLEAQQAQQPHVLAARIADLRVELLQQQQVVAQQQAAIIAGQAQQIAEQAARIADLQQQLAGQQQVAEQQSAQIAGLQAQLQVLLQRLPGP